MADEPGSKAAATPVGVSASASAHAPFLFFDNVANFGVRDGIAGVTLEALRHTSAQGGIVNDRVVVAHLRMSLGAAVQLREALNGVILAATPSPSSGAN